MSEIGSNNDKKSYLMSHKMRMQEEKRALPPRSVLYDDRKEIPFFQLMRETHSLPGVLDRVAPHPGIPEAIDKIAMEFPADILHTAA